MPLVPSRRSAFERRFAALDPSARLAFVADLYAARGWTVERSDGAVVASRNGDRRRIAVVEPSWRRTALPDDADTVVVTRDDAGAREAAVATGVDYRTPADLRDALRYGLDREPAESLAETHFGCSLAALATDPDGRWRYPSVPTAPSLSALSMGWRRWTVVVAALLLVAAGIAGPALAPAFGESNEPPTPAWNDSNTSGTVGAIGAQPAYPPGVSATGVNNSGVLALAHLDSLANRSYTYRLNASGPQHAPFMFGLSRWNATVTVRNRTSYCYHKTEVAPYGFRVETVESIDGSNETDWDPIRTGAPDAEPTAEVLTKRVYADGVTKYWRYEGPKGVRYRQASVEQGDGYVLGIRDQVAWIRIYLERFLWAEESSTRCVEQEALGECRVFRLEVTGEPVELRGDVGDYRAVALVEPSGFVRSLTVRYTIPALGDSTERLPVRFHLEYVNVTDESGPLPEPAWLENVENGTATG